MKRKTLLPLVATVPGSVFLEKYVLQLFNQDFRVLRATSAPRQVLAQATSDFICGVANKKFRWLSKGMFSRRLDRKARHLVTQGLSLSPFATIQKFRITNLICFFVNHSNENR